jgi:pyruvate dehydrogenase E2 component (dihydrolipoamide acetyltransferase)
MPQLGLTMEEGTIVAWLVDAGDPVRRGAPIVEITTDKASTEVESPCDGVVERLLAAPGDTLPVGSPLAQLRPTELDAPAQLSAAPADRLPQDDDTIVEPPVRASPAARRLARERGLDVLSLAGQGSGPGGRIRFRDVERALEARLAPAPSPDAPTRRSPLSAVRMATVRHLALAAAVVPITLIEELDAGPLVALHHELRALRPETRVSYTDLIALALGRTLPGHPPLNGSYHTGEPPALELHPALHLSLAVDVGEPSGLVAPVLRNVEALDLLELAARRAALVERARARRLHPGDLEGGTFTLSNLGMYRVRSFTPVVVPPQVAILGVGRIAADAGSPRLALSLTVDHRAVDGAPAARFLTALIALLERPLGLLLPPGRRSDVRAA